MRSLETENMTSTENNLTTPASRQKFAIVKLWPHLKSAEDECIARIKAAARLLNLECVEVDAFARLTVPPFAQLTRDDVDFVLHLHYETPKCYDIFSIVALWNPIEFYHLWGYRRHSAHLLTHDDFVSCESPAADAQVVRLIARSPMRTGPLFHLHHSLAEPILPPTTGEKRLFYVGINWERINSKNGRHAALLRLLDQGNQIRIYGPRLFQGVAVWEGYTNYAGPLPFDGSSIIHKIHQAGVCLCLSSDAHKESSLMSSRLFEGLAAGAVIIADENPFARRFFGDTLLYIDTRVETEELYEKICQHLDWIKENSEKATELAKAAQEIFLERFVLTRTLGRLYEGLDSRRKQLEALYTPQNDQALVTIFCLLPDFSPDLFDRHLVSCECQRYTNLDVRIVVSESDYRLFESRMRKRISESSIAAQIEVADFYEETGSGRVPQKLGKVLSQLLTRLTASDYVQFLGPNETIFSEHVASLLRTLELNPESVVALSDALLKHKSSAGDHADLSTAPKHWPVAERFPIGYARALFTLRELPADLPAALAYLDATCNRLLCAIGPLANSDRCTTTIDIQHPFHEGRMGDIAYHRKEECYIADYLGEPSGPHSLVPPPPGLNPATLSQLSDGQKLQLAADIFHALPLPQFLKQPVLYIYRTWLRKHKSTS